jgi:hypothetical protein
VPALADGSRIRDIVLLGAFGLVQCTGQSATKLSNSPPCLTNSMKDGTCPNGVTGAVVPSRMDATNEGVGRDRTSRHPPNLSTDHPSRDHG